MNKVFKKVMSGAICTSVAIGNVFAVGCGIRDSGEKRDPNKIQIECAIADVGMGTEWLYNLKARFEKDYPKAQVMINVVTTELESTSVASTLASYDYDVLFTNTGIASMEGVDGLTMDLTDLVTKKAYDSQGNYVKEGGTVSIEDRLQSYEGYLDSVVKKDANGNNTYLTMPYYIAPYGCWYDVDLFETEGYFELGYAGLDGEFGTEDDTWGADGEEGTFDDNLPATFTDYKTLIETIAADGYTPFTWSGLHSWMRTFYLELVYMNYEGIDEYSLNWTLEGVDSQADIGTVTLEDSYKLINQDGRKAMLKIADFMTSSSEYFSGDAFKSAQTHLEAQHDFLGSVQRQGAKQIAMILDGAWWENEAKSYMNEMAGEKGAKYAHGARRFGYLPVPHFEADETIGMAEQTNTKNVLRCGRVADLLVNKKAEKATAEKQAMLEDFLLYMQSHDSLVDFSKTTGVIRPIEAYFTKNDTDQFTYMAQQVYGLINTSDLFTPSLEMTNNAVKYSAGSDWMVGSKVGEKLYNEPMLAFAESNVTVAQYLAGQKVRYDEESWNKKIASGQK